MSADEIALAEREAAREPGVTRALRLAHSIGVSIDDLVDRIYWNPGETARSPEDRRPASERLSGIEPDNLRRRGLKPIVQEVDAPWAGFHTFRHTFASIHLSQGTNLLQLSRALGHHSAAFTLSRYTHLLPGDEAPALDLSLATADLIAIGSGLE